MNASKRIRLGRMDCQYCGGPDAGECRCDQRPEPMDRCPVCHQEIALSQIAKHMRGCGVMA